MNTTMIRMTSAIGMTSGHTGLRVVDTAVDLARETRLAAVGIRGHRDLVDQLTRAIESVALNLAEGAGRAGRDKVYHYNVAYGSAGEAGTAMRLLAAYGALSDDRAVRLLGQIDQVRAVCWRLARR